MSILDLDPAQNYICGVLLAISAEVESIKDDNGQNFYDTRINTGNFIPIYNSKGKVNFSEKGVESDAGMVYTQNLRIQFPNSGSLRSERLKKITQTKFIQIRLTSGQKLLLGRNDFNQNKAPSIKIDSTERFSQIIFETRSIFSVGYVINNLGGNIYFSGLPSMIPLILS